MYTHVIICMYTYVIFSLLQMNIQTKDVRKSAFAQLQ